MHTPLFFRPFLRLTCELCKTTRRSGIRPRYMAWALACLLVTFSACGGGGGDNAGPAPGPAPGGGGGTGVAAAAIAGIKSEDTQKKVDIQPFPIMIRAAADANSAEFRQLVALGPAAFEDILAEFRKTPSVTDDAHLSLLAYALEKIGDKRAIPVLADWLDQNMFVGFPGWPTDFVAHTIKVLQPQSGLNTSTFTYLIDEKFDTLLQARGSGGSINPSGASANLVVAGVVDGNLTAYQKNVCQKTILVTGVNAAGQEVTIPINYKVVTRDTNFFINDPATPASEREAARKRRANWGIDDEGAYVGTPYVKDPGAIITDASNCGGSVTEKVVNQLTAQLGIPISVGKGQADATPISEIAKTFGTVVGIKDIDPLTVISMGNQSVGHVELPVSVTGNSVIVQSKFNYGFLRFHTIDTNSPEPAFTQFQASVDYLKGDDEPGAGGVQVNFYKIDPARIRRIVVDSSRCACTPGDPDNIPVQISQPTKDEVPDRVVTVEGSAGTGGATILSGATLSVNGNPQNISLANGSFQAQVVLRSGDNEIKVSVEGVDGRRGCAIKKIKSTTPKTTISATLTWTLGNTDVDLYVTQPDTQTAWWRSKTTQAGGRLDVDNTSGFGPENYFIALTDNSPLRAGLYSIRVHYYSDRQKDATHPVRPVNWKVVVLLDEGTPKEKYEVYTGTLSSDNSNNDAPGSSGPDWATARNVTLAPAGP